ncbi:MAG: hypothetical protein R3E62_10710 [Pseudomonadales bacterium]
MSSLFNSEGVREKTYFQELAEQKEKKASSRNNTHEQQLKTEELERKQRLLQMANTPLNAKQWESLSKTDPLLYWSPEGQEMRRQHRQTLGMLFEA